MLGFTLRQWTWVTEMIIHLLILQKLPSVMNVSCHDLPNDPHSMLKAVNAVARCGRRVLYCSPASPVH